MNGVDQYFEDSSPLALQDPTVKIGRHDVISVIKSGELPIAPGLFRVVWANRKSALAFLLRFPEREEDTAVSTGRKQVKPKLHSPVPVNLAVLEEHAEKRWVIKARAIVPRRLNRNEDELTEAEKSVKLRRKKLVSSFKSPDDLIRIFEEGEMGKYVTRAIKEQHNNAEEMKERLTRYHVYQVVYRFWLFACRDIGLTNGCVVLPGNLDPWPVVLANALAATSFQPIGEAGCCNYSATHSSPLCSLHTT